MILQDVLAKSVEFIKKKNLSSTPRLDAEMLFAFGLKCARIDLYLKSQKPLTDGEIALLRDLVMRRSRGEPVAYITGTKDFYGRTFFVNPEVLIPRPETEYLVDTAISFLQKKEQSQIGLDESTVKSFRVLDMGTGSGVIGISLALERPDIKVSLLDSSEGALVTAKKNAEHFGVLDSMEFILGDAAFYKGSKAFDIILANPPYIKKGDSRVEPAVHQYEPHEALYSDGDDGLDCIKSWLRQGILNAKASSLILFEIGADQGSLLLDYVKGLSNEFTNLNFQASIEKDLSGCDRYLQVVVENG